MTTTDTAWIDEIVSTLGFRRIREDEWSVPDEADFAEIEALVGGRLPEPYRAFVSRYGGGMLGTDDWTVRAPLTEVCPWGKAAKPEEFYVVGKGRDSVAAKVATYRGRIPRGTVPIADDPSGNQICLDVAGSFPGSVWFWDHEQRWFGEDLEAVSREVDASGVDARRLSVHGIIRAWARLHPDRFDRPADYMGMYRIAPSFPEFLRSLEKEHY